MLSAASRSAIVRATFRMRSCARAERPRRVMALAGRVAEIAAGTRIHRGSQHETGGEGHRNRGPGYRHRTVLERLPHYLKYIALKFRQFIQEEHAIVAQRNFAWPGHSAAANEPRIADGMRSEE